MKSARCLLWTGFLAIATTLALPAAQATARPADGDFYAIVVGYNGAQAGLPTLRYADDDAVRLAHLLSGFTPGGGSTHVWLLTDLDDETRGGLTRAGLGAAPDGAPTRAAVMDAFAAAGRALASRPAGAPPPTFYFIYAGHGLHGRILLAPEAGTDAGLTGAELRSAVAELARAAPSLRAYVFLDACRSQSLFTERGAADGQGPDLSADVSALEERARELRLGVLTAAFSAKTAGEVHALGAGYFSYVLASGLAGAADADGDQLVSFAELAAFVAYNTERLGAQRPWFSPPAGDLAATVVDLRAAGARLDLSGSPEGRYLVGAAGGWPLFAEAIKGQRLPLRLALPAGHYRVVRATREREPARAAEIDLVAGAPLDLARSSWSDAPGGLVRARGEADGATAGASADAPEPAFGSAFTPEAVSTLKAAYQAGREPPTPSRAYGATLAVVGTAGSAPVGLTGVEAGLAVRYRQRLRALALGVVASFGRSSHAAAPGADYHLERYALLVEVGPRLAWADRVELSLAALAGGGPLVRRADGAPASGDLFAPLVGVGAEAQLRLVSRWSVHLGGRWSAQWVSIDGDRRAATGVAAEAGLGWSF